MKAFLSRFVRTVDAVNYRTGRFVIYGIFLMIGILLWSSVSKTFFEPSLWTLEIAQFAMVSYYMLGGPYAMQLGANVRMDLFYGEWSDTRKAQIDAFTVFFLMFYLGVLLHGGLTSLAYSLGHFKGDTYSFFLGLITGYEDVGRLERSPTAWRPYLWPIKLIMCAGVFMMLLQAISELIKDVAKIRGVSL
ncbi:TRAP transporter small permease subunit [Coralliovum pocilloporae]|uniref:TRAP transporter small permease subunit n=1 Tax=Coralliovum pocilloporae TaxID=3066369 RepID=UPI0033078D07